MSDTNYRIALLLLAAGGVLTTGWVPGWPAAAGPAYRELLVTLLGLALVASLAVPAIRLPAVTAALLEKLAFLAASLVPGHSALAAPVLAEAVLVLALALAAAIMVRRARIEARWDGALAWRPES